MFIKYQPEILPRLLEIFGRFADRTKGLDGFRDASHWEARFTSLDIDPARDIIILKTGASDHTNQIRAFSWLFTKSAPNNVYLRGPFADPGDPEVSTAIESIIETAVNRAAELDAGYIEGRSLFTEWDKAYVETGFTRMGAYQRWRLFPVKGTIPLADIPSGGDIRAWSGSSDIRVLMGLFTGAFRDHWDYQEPKKQEWEEIIRGKSFDPSLLLTGFDDGTAVGYVFGQNMPDSTNPGIQMAYLVSIGIHPDHQGRGWGRALLTRWLRSIYGSSARAAELDVDAENLRAMDLYRSLGFRFLKQEEVYRKYL